MGGTGVVDRFLDIFSRYIDSGFGLLGGEVAFIATTLIVIDVTLAALFWSWGEQDDILALRDSVPHVVALGESEVLFVAYNK